LKHAPLVVYVRFDPFREGIRSKPFGALKLGGRLERRFPDCREGIRSKPFGALKPTAMLTSFSFRQREGIRSKPFGALKPVISGAAGDTLLPPMGEGIRSKPFGALKHNAQSPIPRENMAYRRNQK
jgi:hypothetical protein